VRFAVVVVTFHPDADALANLRVIAGSGARLFVIDNTPLPEVPEFEDLPGTTVVRPGENIGLAAALNLGIRQAGEEGFEDIFLFDQDSRPLGDFFSNMLTFRRSSGREPGGAVLCVSDFYDRNTRTYARFPLFTRWTFRRRTCAKLRAEPARETVMAITAGSLLSYSGFVRTGPFREDYFIDGIDTEYCLRLGKLGFRTALNCRAAIDQALGNRMIRKFFGLTMRPSFHAAIRRYYESRNGLRTALKYLVDFPLYLPLFMAGIAQESLSILLYEPGKARKLGAQLAGLVHGLAGRGGRCPLSWLRD
jgi:rhamnosyltransferase